MKHSSLFIGKNLTKTHNYNQNCFQMSEFKLKMGSILPKIPKNNPPQSRTEFEGLTDLLNYVTTDFSQHKAPKTEDEES